MAQFLVRIFRDRGDFLAVVDGWGTVRSPTLQAVREEAKKLVHEIINGAFHPRSAMDRKDGIEVLRLRLEVKEEREGQDPAAGSG